MSALRSLAVVALLLAGGAASAQGTGAADGGTQPPGSAPSAPALTRPDGGTQTSTDAADAGTEEPSDRPTESDLFGAPPSADEAGVPTDRPAEDELFGGGDGDDSQAGETDPTDRPEQPADSQTGRDDRVLSAPPAKDRFATGEMRDNALDVGGQFYFRYFANAAENAQFKNVAFSSPNLLDLYLDGRPSDRIRGFARFRMRYDPTFDPAAPTQFSRFGSLLGGPGNTGSGGGTGGTGSGQSQDSGTGTPTVQQTARANPDFLLDQLWLNFDVARTVFVTAGRQHIRWTVSRFWQPTDFLSPQLRDPLAVFDQRLGANAVKLHVPIEKLGWNFYAVSLLDNFGPANTFGELGQAFRGEFVFGPAELSLTTVFQRGRGPRYGADISAGVGPFDLYAEAALHPRANRRNVRFTEETSPSPFEDVLENQIERGLRGLPNPPAYESFLLDGPVVQTTVGATWTVAYSDTDTVTFGAEYFHNPYGYDDERLFAAALTTNTYVPFYAGRHYAGLFAVLFGPGRMDNGTFIFSTLGNLSDRSFISRLDFSYRALSFLQLEAFAAYHYGRAGEFNFGVNLPADRLNIPPRPGDGQFDPATPDQRAQIEALRRDGVVLPRPTFDIGIGARISL